MQHKPTGPSPSFQREAGIQSGLTERNFAWTPASRWSDESFASNC
jgi:hypothetical protein